MQSSRLCAGETVGSADRGGLHFPLPARRWARAAAERVYALVSGRPAFRAKYDLARLRRRSFPGHDPADLVLVMPPDGSGGWILDAICREIAAYVPGRTTLVRSGDRLPRGKAYFFSHYEFFRWSLLREAYYPGPCLVFFTHPSEERLGNSELAYVLNRADCVVSMCRLFADSLGTIGVAPSRISVATIGADPGLFPARNRGNGAVGLCTAYYPRKNPDRILSLVRAMPHRQFILLGRDWRKWSRFSELDGLPNFSYEEHPYSDYPAFYARIDVFVSMSALEGGPVPVVEAMMSNCVPVASRMGLALDVIEHGVNGFLFEVDAPIDDVALLVEEAYGCRADIRTTVQHLTWRRFSEQIQGLAGLTNNACDPAGRQP
jgi:glycosyltransferase involved in cell wall biosynthesis